MRARIHVVMVMAALAALVSLAPADASATTHPPSACMAGGGSRGYQQGYRYERRLLETIWSRFDCDTLEDFVKAVEIDPWTSSSSRFLECRNTGIVDAVYDVIDEKTAFCVDACFDSGVDIGRKQADVYCGLPLDRGFTAMDLNLCQTASEQACESAFRSRVNSRCRWKADQDPEYERFVDRACDFSG